MKTSALCFAVVIAGWMAPGFLGAENALPIRKGVLRDIRSKGEVDALVKALGSADAAERIRALSQGAGIMRKDFKQAVLACVQHKDTNVQQAALKLILPCGVCQAYDRLAEELSPKLPGHYGQISRVEESDTELRLPQGDIVRQFRALGDAAIPVLFKKLKAEDAETRYIAASLLGLTRSPKAVSALRAALSDGTPRIRARAVRALGYVGGKEALEAIAGASNVRDPAVLKEVAVALARHRDVRAIPVLKNVIEADKGDYAGYWAPGWLDGFPFKLAVPVLIDGLSHQQRYIRRNSYEALKRLTGQSFGYGAGTKTGSAAQKKAIQHWRAWWKDAQRKQRHEILADSLNGSNARRMLPDLVTLGETAAIPGLLVHYGDRDMRAITPNEIVDVDWALRILAVRIFDSHAGWTKWWEANRNNLPKKSPLVAPFNPLKEVANVEIAPAAEHVAADGHLMFVAGRSWLELYDITDVARPERIGRYGTPCIDQLAASKGRLFLTTHAKGLHVYAYTPQGDLEHVSSHREVKYKGYFRMAGNRLLVSNYVFLNDGKTALYDISGRGAPRLLDVCDAADLRQHSVSGTDGFFTTANWSGNEITTEGCFPMRTVQRRVWPNGTAVADASRFYCLDHGVLIVRDLKTGRLLGRAPARARYDAALLVDGGRAYALLDEMGIVIYDVKDPSNIKVLSHTPLPRQPRARLYRGFFLTGGRLFCANYEGELRVLALPKSWK